MSSAARAENLSHQHDNELVSGCSATHGGAALNEPEGAEA